MIEKCKEQVFRSHGSFRGAPCARDAVRDGYCTQHHPDTRNARDTVRRARRDAEHAASVAIYEQQDRERAVLRAAKAWADTGGLHGMPTPDTMLAYSVLVDAIRAAFPSKP